MLLGEYWLQPGADTQAQFYYASFRHRQGNLTHENLLLQDVAYVGSDKGYSAKQPPATPVKCGYVDSRQNNVVPQTLQK